MSDQRKGSLLPTAFVVALATGAGFFWFGLFDRPEADQIPPSAFEVRVRLSSLEGDRPKHLRLVSSAGFRIRWNEGAEQDAIDFVGPELILHSDINGDDESKMLAVRLPNGVRQPRFTISAHAADGAAQGEDGLISLSERIYYGKLVVEIAGDVVKDTGEDDTFLRVTAMVPVEHYLAGVVGPEIGATQAMPALEAQAIAARTYAAHRMSRKGLLLDTASSQVFRGIGVLDLRVLTALQRTAGKILSIDGEKPLAAFYHSTCGGHTARGADVFPYEANPIPGVASPDCEGTPYYRWSYALNHDQGSKLMAQLELGTELIGVQAERRDAASGRWIDLLVKGDAGHRTLTWSEWKIACSRAQIPVPKDLLWLDVSVVNGALAVNGGGNGHGVGMCQMCARRMGERGASAEEILARFYPGARIHRLPVEAKP